MTNYDRIKQMSVDEMAREISCGGNCDYCVAKDRCNRLPLDVVATIPCKKELAERFVIGNARKRKLYNYCPNCGAKMDLGDDEG